MRTHIRAGFTLIELMVAMALTLFIMVILSQAFVLSLEVFAGMKGLGDMQVVLRTATTMLRDDLNQDHFEGKRRLSDVGLTGVSTFVGQLPLIPPQLPQAGFFAVMQGSPASKAVGSPYFIEGTDSNGLTSYRATNHVLYMTVKRRGNRQENFFTTSMTGNVAYLNTFFGVKPVAVTNTAYDVAPANLPYETLTLPYTGASPAFYSSQWAEVLYYLVRVGSTEEPYNNTSTLGTPTYELYRAQYVMVPDGTNLSSAPKNPPPAAPGGWTGKFKSTLNLQNNTFMGLSCNPNTATGYLDFYSPADAASYVATQTPVVKRLLPTPATFNPQAAAPNAATTRAMLNQALVLPNVISFQIQVMRTGGTTFVDTPLYDTTTISTATAANATGLKAIQITLRVWDNKTRQTRQITVVQDL